MHVFFASPWVPAEWIRACGLEPRGVWFAQNFWRDALPLSAGVCAFAEAVVRFADAQTEAAVIFPTTCDQLRRGFEACGVAAQSRAFLFNVPAVSQSPTAARLYRSEVERLGRFLETLGGHAPSPQDLQQEIRRYGQSRSRLLQAAPQFSARAFAEAAARFHWDGSINLPPTSAAPDATGVPLAIVGGPLTESQFGLLDAIEAAGGRVVLNATEAGERSLWPSSPGAESADDPFDALVRDYLDHIVDVFQRPNTRLYTWLREPLAARGVRGLVLWHHTGCDLWRAEAQTLRETFGLPLLPLEADAAQACSPRDAGRLQAFVETLT